VTALAIAVVFLMFVLGEPKGPWPGIHSREWAGMVLLFGAIAAMVLAWKWEFPAAVISLFALGAFVAVVHINRYGVLVILAIPNVLFLLDGTLRRLQVKRAQNQMPDCR
jgi:ABC-type phosphate transport system permease subunit